MMVPASRSPAHTSLAVLSSFLLMVAPLSIAAQNNLVPPPADPTALREAASDPSAAGTLAEGDQPTLRQARPQEGDAWSPSGPPLQGHVEDANFGLPMPWGEKSFESFRSAYLSPDGKKWLAAIMERARPYLFYISERLRYYGLPEELAFLPVVESEYSPQAVSKSGATGLWQFMRNSIAGYGIRIDDWVDERRDFMKSSDGALRKLADNYETFGDWDLAIAAYNAGDGAIARALVRAKREGATAPDYWELRSRGLLGSETDSYVPKFLAIASILRYPGRNGIALSWDPPLAWEAVEPGRPVDLAMLAKATGLDLDLLRRANPELRYGVTPPSTGYRLKVPADAVDSVRAVLDDKSLALVKYYLHTVRSGDTLSGLSRSYGAPMTTILQSNPGMRADLLRIGQVIVVPALKNAAPPPSPPPPKDELAFSGSYTIVKGDTLWSISLKFDVQPELLADQNGLSLGGVIREGMTLRVPIVN